MRATARKRTGQGEAQAPAGRLTKSWAYKDLTADPGERSVVAMISTMVVDRDGDVVLPGGMDATDFRANPVVMLSHGREPLPIGTGQVKRVKDGILAKTTFTPRPPAHPAAAEWLPDTVFHLFQQRVLRAFSIGFIPTEVRAPTEKDLKQFGQDVQRVIVAWKLLEYSIVALPANQEALALAVSKGMRRNLLTDLWEIRAEPKRAFALDSELPQPFIIDPLPA